MSDASELWLIPYSQDLEADEDFRADLEQIWITMRPFYEKLHAWVRYKYRTFWGEKYPGGARDPIPAHLTGNMWAQSWHLTFDIVNPFKNASNPLEGIDDELIDQVSKE